MPKAGDFHNVVIAVDPTVHVTEAGTETHAVIFASTRRELDAKLTKSGWTRNEGFYYAPPDWKDSRLVLPTYIQWKDFVNGLFLQDPANLRTDFLFFSSSEPMARMYARRMGWKKGNAGLTKQG